MMQSPHLRSDSSRNLDASVVPPAMAMWNQRAFLGSKKSRILELSQAVDWPGDLWPFQWAQLMAFTREFQPDLILELGRGMGNSTCAFTEVAHAIGSQARVVSLCLSDTWEVRTLPRLRSLTGEGWYRPLETHRTNILLFDYQSLLKDADRVCVFWDAHGFDVAECVLGRVLPLVADKPHVVVMHDLSDARYGPESTAAYGGHRLWKGNNWEGPRLRIGHIDSAVEQSIAITDFTTRNSLPLHSADESLHEDLDHSQVLELRALLGDGCFSQTAGWFWFSLNEARRPHTYPRFSPSDAEATAGSAPPMEMKRRVRSAARILLKGR